MKYVTLPCGCKISETTMHAMCMQHVQELHLGQTMQRASYENFILRMDQLFSSPARR